MNHQILESHQFCPHHQIHRQSRESRLFGLHHQAADHQSSALDHTQIPTQLVGGLQ